ncbi:heterokaryon incompatibility protein [Lasiodiplodia theobromae]|nr:heterokaryon incompatibility protein [Lasiodiplodia theobromae]
MRQIYQRCVLNIAADRAGSPHEGAFVRRSSDAAALQGCQVFWKTGRGDGDGDGDMWTVVDDRDLNGGFFAAPLTRRAWVFQERFLAPRVLHFGADQVWWECAELGFASEVMPEGMPRAHPLFDLAGAPFSIPRAAPLPLPETTEEEEREKAAWRDNIMNEWQRAVATYAKARLTFVEKDVFAAFAGVAEMFGNSFYADDEYIAGHFRSELPWCLLWECQGMRRPSPRDTGAGPACRTRR